MLFISLFVLALVVLTYIAQLYVTCLSFKLNSIYDYDDDDDDEIERTASCLLIYYTNVYKT